VLHVSEDVHRLEGARAGADGNLGEVADMKPSQMLEDTDAAWRGEVTGVPVNHGAAVVSGNDPLRPVVGAMKRRAVSLRAVLGLAHLDDGSTDPELGDRQMPGRPLQAFPSTTLPKVACAWPVCGGPVGGFGVWCLQTWVARLTIFL
jgi:hypothetical protein